MGGTLDFSNLTVLARAISLFPVKRNDVTELARINLQVTYKNFDSERVNIWACFPNVSILHACFILTKFTRLMVGISWLYE